MVIHTFLDEESGTTYTLDDDGPVLPAGTSEEFRREAWRARAEADAFWLLFPEWSTGS